MLENLSLTNGFHLRRALTNFGVAAGLVLMLAITASAYTLVLRNGQRLEIPSEFTLTKVTLTYEISPGFNKTMQLVLIDVAATERANNEAPGGFFKHTEESPVAAQPAPQATRTLTNRDLVAVRQRRLESEQAYETRRKELGLPTVEETRRRQEEEGTALRAQIREENEGKAREESYWRGRARELRTEIATVDTQINYLRGRIGEFNENSLSDLVITDVYPIWPRTTRQSRGWPYYPNAPFGYPRVARPVPGLGLPYPYRYPTGPLDNFDKSSERADLTNRVDDLLVRRAGLSAQWRMLEDEARDARIPQIWLEP
jgi:hypothetical protein